MRGSLYFETGLFAKAQQDLQQSLQLRRQLYREGKLPDPRSLVAVLQSLNRLHFALEDFAEAVNNCNEALQIIDCLDVPGDYQENIELAAILSARGWALAGLTRASGESHYSHPTGTV